MKLRKVLVGLLAAATIAVGLGTQKAEAQNFTFTSTYASTTITSNTSGTGVSTLTFTNGASTGPIGTPTAVVLGNISEFTTVGGGPNSFVNDPYTITFTIHDIASGTTQSATFHGLINGTADGGVGGNAPSAFFTDTPTAPTTLHFTFATGTYTVDRTTFVSPGPSGAADGSQGANVFFTPVRTTVPEPATTASFGIGIFILAGMAFSRRRKNLNFA